MPFNATLWVGTADRERSESTVDIVDGETRRNINSRSFYFQPLYYGQTQESSDTATAIRS